MGDDDVICLSSDDETSPAEPPTKKSKVAEEPIKAEFESTENGLRRDSNLKRKSAPRNDDDAGVPKRQRVSVNGDVEEITVEPSPRSTNGESKCRASTESRESSKSSSSRSDSKRSGRREDAASSSDRATVVARETRSPRESGVKDGVQGVRNFFAKSSDVRGSSGLSPSKTLDDRTRRKVENVFGSSEDVEPVRSRSPTARIFAKSRENLSSEGSNDGRRKGSSKDTERGFVWSSSKPSRESTDHRTSREDSSSTSKSRESESQRHARDPKKSNEGSSRDRRESAEMVGGSEASRIDRSKRSNEDGTKERASNPPRDYPSSGPKESSTKSVRTSGRKSSSERSSKSSPSSKKSSPDVEIVETAKTSSRVDADAEVGDVARSSDAPRAKDKNASRQSSEDATSVSKISSTDVSRTPRGSPKKQDAADRRERASPSTSLKSPLVKSVTILSKRVTPTTLEVGRKSSEVGTEPRSEQSKDERSTEPTSDGDRSAKPFEPVAGCSKTPDAVYAGTSCSSSRDESKPHLVVKTKTPVVSVEQDTFAMFLGLCLQIDRSQLMEKIVAKLKRNYEQLDPSYARSRAFVKLVNDTREKINARGRLYYYIGQVAEEMKVRRRRDRSSKASNDAETTAENAEAADEPACEDEELEDRQESRRLRAKIKTIEIAMKKCSKKIEQLEVAEIDFDDENNSHYIMLGRYKEKMVELYAKLCEYTNEHADAGRSYLRPKHLRVCQIPSIDQAINSFVNSKLSSGRTKAQTGKSFVDGLVFPDYVDILECVAKVNEKQNLGLDKRRQQKLAEEAFTRLGKHLQDARQKDYWDTFSLHLENSKDPVTADSALSEKLLHNQAIAEKNTRAIFAEYVKKQEEGTAADQESTSSGSEDDDDDDDDDDEDNDDNGKKSNCEVSDVVLSDTDNHDDGDTAEDSDEKENNEGTSRTVETINESARETADTDVDERDTRTSVEDPTSEKNATTTGEEIVEEAANQPKRTEETLATEESMEIEESSCEAEIPAEKICVRVDDELSAGVRGEENATSENNNVLKTSETRTVDRIGGPDESEERLIENETTKNEANPSEEASTESTNEVTEPPRILRIRSFAKPPSSWASSQELDNTENSRQSPTAPSGDSETIDLLDDESPMGDNPLARPSDSDASSVETRRVTRNSNDATQQQHAINGSTPVNLPSKVIKLVPKVDSTTLTKQFGLLPGLKIQAVNGHASQQRNGQQQQFVGGKSAIAARTLNVSRNIKIYANQSTPSPALNVRVCSLEKPQRIEVRVAKNLRTLPPGQLKVVKLADTSGLARANGAPDNAAPIPLRPRAIANPAQVIGQPLQIQSLNNVQAVRLRAAPDSQILQQSNAQQQHQQIVRLSNGQLMKTSSAIRPIGANPPVAAAAPDSQILQQSNAQQQHQQILRLSNGQLMKTSSAIRPIAANPPPVSAAAARSITLNNPRLLRLPGNALTGATVARLTETGQLRVERIENSANPRAQRLTNGVVVGGGNNVAPRTARVAAPPGPARSQREQRTNPLHKARNARKE